MPATTHQPDPAARSRAPTSPRPRPLDRRDGIALLALIALFTGAAVALGQSTAWDSRNYHLYVAWAWLGGREGLDIAPGQLQTYFNPLPYVPIYWSTTWLPPAATNLLIGLAQAASAIPLYLVARRLLASTCDEPHRWVALACTFAGMTAATAVSELGTTYLDSALAIFPLAALACLLGAAPPRENAAATFAGLLAGIGAGLKLTALPWALGVLIVAILLPPGGTTRMQRLARFALAGALGFALAAGPSLWSNYASFGNPMYPLYADWFGGELSPPFDVRDPRWRPRNLTEYLTLPLLWTLNWRRVGELPFRDLRMLVYLPLLVASAVMIRRRGRVPGPVLPAVAVGVLAMYLCWLVLFGYHRYLVLAEMLAPALCVAMLQAWLPTGRATMIAIGVLLAGLILSTRPANLGRLPHYAQSYLDVDLPVLARQGELAVVMANDAPLAYLAPAFPAGTRFLRIGGNFFGGGWPPYGIDLAVARALDAHRGPLLLLVEDRDRDVIDTALVRFGLRAAYSDCEPVRANLASTADATTVVCPLQRASQATDALRAEVEQWEGSCKTPRERDALAQRICDSVRQLDARMPATSVQ